jgi:hypothetical protein
MDYAKGNTKYNFAVYIINNKIQNFIMNFSLSMRTIAAFSILMIFFMATAKHASAKEYEVAFDMEDLYNPQVIETLFRSDESPVPAINNLKGTKKIVIVDHYGNTIREERILESEGICQSSTLVPLIYKCALITEIDQVCYFLLNQNNH